MQIEITAGGIITAASVLAAMIAIAGYLFKAHDWVQAQDGRKNEIEALRKQHNADISAVQEEQTLIVYGVLACLDGLTQLGCNHEVTNAKDKLDKHLNKKAHNQI